MTIWKKCCNYASTWRSDPEACEKHEGETDQRSSERRMQKGQRRQRKEEVILDKEHEAEPRECRKTKIRKSMLNSLSRSNFMGLATYRFQFSLEIKHFW